MANLILPEKIIIQLTDSQNRPLVFPDVVFFVHFFAKHKNDFHLGPFVSDQSGKVAISHQELVWNIQATYDSGLMDYSAVETCHPSIEIILEYPDIIKRTLTTREKVWSVLLKGEKERWGALENLLNVYRCAKNDQIELSKDFMKIRDTWDGTKKEYNYNFPISLKK
jgi:hypothetical protein